GNIAKYAMPGSRVYFDVVKNGNSVDMIFKNTSRDELNISAEELMERFVRGDRSRHTEGSGLGLNIARSLTELMGGTMKLTVDGDLFKVTVSFPAVTDRDESWWLK
ncbi:MAG: sensor histidine kinase, partial [Solobacterium sp.]|nr:sensor histidine kinase [Solobacterium sp.]